MDNIKFINQIYNFLSILQDLLNNDRISRNQIKTLIKIFILNYLKPSIEIEKMLNGVIPEWSITEPNV